MLRISQLLALLGGIILLISASMVVTSVLLVLFFKSNVPGDFEMASMANAMAMFAFFPLCTWNRGHVIVDSFTGWLSPATNEKIDIFWNCIIGIFFLFMGWRTFLGAMDSMKSGLVTSVKGIPLYPSIFFCAAVISVTGIMAFLNFRRNAA
jgi:TRAP-type C4-dicarboxylate transport system permease small subunit